MVISLYIANLGKYNEGELVGDWINLPASEEELNKLFSKIKLGYFDDENNYNHGYMENENIYEEFAIHDYEAPFRINEYDDLNRLNNIAEIMSNLDDESIKIAIALIDNGYESNIEDALEQVTHMGDIIIYYEKDLASIAQSLYEESGTMDDDNPLYNYIDWERVGRDMSFDGTYIEVDDDLWIEVLY